MLAIELPWLENVAPAKVGRRLPVVLARNEVQLLLHAMRGTPGLIARLLYGIGMRLMEGVRLRIKDINFERCELVVRESKGNQDRITLSPTTLKDPLQEHLKHVFALYFAARWTVLNNGNECSIDPFVPHFPHLSHATALIKH